MAVLEAKKKIKPVYVMDQEGLSGLERKAVLDGASDLIQLAGAFGVDIVGHEIFRNHESADWYIEAGRQASRNSRQLNAFAMQYALGKEHWRDLLEGGKDHYDMLVVNEDMYSHDTNFVVGIAQAGIGTTVSTYRFRDLGDQERYECIKTETMHELGHVFGLVPAQRTQDVAYSLGKHCTNKCIMRQGLRLPIDWINITNDRLKHGALCPRCESDLKQYFMNSPG